jgi:hypothetical protein
MRVSQGITSGTWPMQRPFLLQALFRPSAAVAAMTRERVAALPWPLDTAPYVAVHMRIGEDAQANLSFADPTRHKVSDVPHFLACTGAVSREIAAPRRGPQRRALNAARVSVLVASDVQRAKTAFLAAAAAAARPAAEVTYESAFHIDRSAGLAHELAARGDRLAWVELILLAGARCKVLSTFLLQLRGRKPRAACRGGAVRAQLPSLLAGAHTRRHSRARRVGSQRRRAIEAILCTSSTPALPTTRTTSLAQLHSSSKWELCMRSHSARLPLLSAPSARRRPDPGLFPSRCGSTVFGSLHEAELAGRCTARCGSRLRSRGLGGSSVVFLKHTSLPAPCHTF